MSDKQLPERVLAVIEQHGGWQGVLDYIATLAAERDGLRSQCDELRAALRKAIDHGMTLATRLDAVTRDRDERDVRHFNEMEGLRRDRDNWRERAAIDTARSQS